MVKPKLDTAVGNVQAVADCGGRQWDATVGAANDNPSLPPPRRIATQKWSPPRQLRHPIPPSFAIAICTTIAAECGRAEAAVSLERAQRAIVAETSGTHGS